MSRSLAVQIIEAELLPTKWSNENWIKAITATIWKELTPAEIMVGMAFAGQYRLNPFLNEFYMVMGRPFVGRDGFLKVGTADPRYVDHVFGKVYAKDTFEHLEDGSIKHTSVGFGEGVRGEFLGAFCTVWTKGDEGTVRARTYEAELTSFPTSLTKKDNWTNDPQGMCVVRVITSAFRSTFSLGNLYMVEESKEILETTADKITSATEEVVSSLSEKLEPIPDVEPEELEEEAIEAEEVEDATEDAIDAEEVAEEAKGVVPDEPDDEAHDAAALLRELAGRCSDAKTNMPLALEILCAGAKVDDPSELTVPQVQNALDLFPELMALVAERQDKAESESEGEES